MTNSFLRQAIVISFLWHLTLFGMFRFSFGPKGTQEKFSHVYFWGAILNASDLASKWNFDIGNNLRRISGKSEIMALNKISRQEDYLAPIKYFKPAVSLAFNEEKVSFAEKPLLAPPMAQKKESAIMFYPALPYNFELYFKDRQSAHIELSFQVISGDKRSSVLVKRKISSGNLEADLLSMRYISRYLFMQQNGFTPGKWQTVKIDLTTAND